MPIDPLTQIRADGDRYVIPLGPDTPPTPAHGDVLEYDAINEQWIFAPNGAGGGANLSWTAATSTVASDTGTDAVLTNANSTDAGLMSSADFDKLAAIEANATADQNAADIRALGFFDTTNDGAGSLLDADLLDGEDGSWYQDRTNHTGTQAHTTISDFDAGVQTNRLDQMAAPTAAVDWNGQQITSVAAPTNTDDVPQWSDTFEYRTVNAQTGTTYTLALGDAGALVTMNNAAANTLTVPTNASVAFPVNTRIAVGQKGAGVTTINGPGVTLNAAGGDLSVNNQYGVAFLVKTGTDEWWVEVDQSGAGATNLTWTAATRTVASSTGDDAVISLANGTDAGLMASADYTKLSNIEALADVTDATNVDAAGAVMEADFDAQTILRATTDNTPAPLTVGEQTLVGRITAGNIEALTPAQIRTLINVEDGATADQTTEEIQDIAGPLVATGGTKTGISVVYDDTNNDMDFIVDSATDTQPGIVELATDAETDTGTATNRATTPANVKQLTLDHFAAPAADVDWNSQKITSLAEPTASDDAATKAYVDATASGLDLKDSVRAATSGSNITLSGTQTVDGVSLVVDDRILVKDQTAGEDNGIYVVAAGAWSRSTDADVSAEVTSGMFVFVEEGTANGDNGFVLTTNDPITLGTTSLVFTQFSGAGQIVAGAALTKSGNTLDVAVDDSSIEVSGDALRVKADGITYDMMQDVTATDRFLGRDTAGAGTVEELTAAVARGILNVEDGATADQTAAEIGTAVHLVGLDSGKPTPSAANDGVLYLSTDINGGTLYRSNASAWVAVAAGVNTGDGDVTAASNIRATSIVVGDDGAKGVAQTTGIDIDASDNMTGVQTARFETTGGLGTHAEGKVGWDPTDHTLAQYLDEADITQQLGQEFYIRVYNNSGATIVNGKPVYVSGTEATENRPTIALAQADAADTSQVIGFSTHDIENSTYGYVTSAGLINDLATDTFTSGDPLYLDATTAGGLVTTPPATGSGFKVLLGYVVRSHATLGRVLVTIGADTSALAGDAGELVIQAQKGSVGTINAGDVVYITGYDTGANVVEVELADASAAGTMPAIGIARSSITQSATGDVVVVGQIGDLDTSLLSVGDDVYVSETAGDFTTTKPTGTALVQKIGVVSRSHANFGTIEIIGAGRTNDLPNIASANFWVGNGSGVPTAVTMSGDAAMDNTGAVTIQPDSVTYDMMQDTTGSDLFLGRDTAGAGTIEEIGAAAARGILNVENGADVTDAANVDAAGAVMESDYNADTILAANADNTPLPLTVAASTFVGRKSTGDISAMTPTQAKTELAIVHTDISDFDAGVQTNRLDQMAAPTATVDFNGQAIASIAAPPAIDDAARYQDTWEIRGVNAQTGTTYTLVLADAGKLVTMTNAAANTLTVPTNASVAFPIGTRIYCGQGGTGATTIDGPGVTLNSEAANLATAGQYAQCYLLKTGTDEWWIDVDIARLKNNNRLLGRGNSGGETEITLGADLEFNGTELRTSAWSGDVTHGAGTQSLTIDSNAVTFAKMQDIATDRLIGRDTAASGDPEEISVTNGLAFTGAGGIGIADEGVTLARMAHVATNTMLGRVTAATGDVEALTAAQARTVMSVPEGDGVAKITVGSTEPTSPSVGDLWVDTT